MILIIMKVEERCIYPFLPQALDISDHYPVHMQISKYGSQACGMSFDYYPLQLVIYL